MNRYELRQLPKENKELAYEIINSSLRNHQVFHDLTVDSTIKSVGAISEKAYPFNDRFESLENKIKEAPIASVAIEYHITFWEEKIKEYPIAGNAYKLVMSGKPRQLKEFASLIFTQYLNALGEREADDLEADNISTNDTFIRALTTSLQSISDAVFLAYTIPLWKDELARLKTSLSNNSTKPVKEIEDDLPLPKKIKWIGTPAQFGFIINELIGKGYIDKPTSSYNKDAVFYLKIFELETTPGNLAKEVNENSNSFTGPNANKFTIPYKDKLS